MSPLSKISSLIRIGVIFVEKKRKKDGEGLRRWELALLVGIALAALLAARLGAEQDALADKVIRLHVVANSDSPEDQALKLKVRDAVLEQGSLYLTGLDREEAMETLTRALPQLGQVAAETVARSGYHYPVRVSLGEDLFPTKNYSDFALPAGSYTALRIELGSGQGHNWWCVVFPPLCLGSVTEATQETAQAAGFSDDQISLITGETQGYVVKFKAMELWEKWKAGLE